jgi:hypothetical protein
MVTNVEYEILASIRAMHVIKRAFEKLIFPLE